MTTPDIPGPSETVVIVGAGIAGVRAALTLRESGFAGRVRLLSDEIHTPYDRPPLSKGVLVDPEGEKRISLDPQQQLAAGGIELLTSARCIAIDRAARTLRLETGEEIAYDRLVLAMGSSVRTIESLPRGAPGVHYLRTLDDALALRAAVGVPSRIAVVGAGVIGLEVAASLGGKGHRVTVIDPAERVMGRSASPVLSSFLERRHRAENIDLRLMTAIVSVTRADGAIGLSLSDGGQLWVDAVIVGVGVLPNIALGQDCGLETRPGGIVTDARGQTSDPAIYAAGEVAFHLNIGLGRHDRQETWAHAATHGEHVAHAIMGRDDGYKEPASYWTDQYDINIQVIGNPLGEQDIVRGDLDAGSGLVFHLRAGRIAGVSAINAVREMRTARKMLGIAPEDPAVLADPAIDLKTMV